MEGLSFSLSVALIGMLVVFVGLVILIFSIQIITALVSGASREKKQKKAEPAAAPVAAPVAAPAPVAAASEGVSAEVLAAITAAIAAVWDNARGGFTVKHVRRISNAPVWSRAGREEQTYSRF